MAGASGVYRRQCRFDAAADEGSVPALGLTERELGGPGTKRNIPVISE